MIKIAKTFLILILFIIVLAAIAGSTLLYIAAKLDKPTGHIDAEGVYFVVDKGEGAASVARRLETQGIIRSELMFRLLMKAKRQETSLKAGEYLIKADMNNSNILNMLTEGKQILLRFTVPEGATLKAIAGMAENQGLAPKDIFLDLAKDPELLAELDIPSSSMEGYLFPDTYFFLKNAGAGIIIRTMADNFKKQIKENIPEAGFLTGSELQEKVILASIVEREYRLPAEAPIMAGVFYNRLKKNIALQSCATVVYVITEIEGKPHPARLFDKDIQIKNEFNTYVNRGLPPAPISNPGLTALMASFRPATTSYYYFRLIDGNSGAHYFSETFSEHIDAAALIPKAK